MREAARDWVIRLASGEMDEAEQRIFSDWLTQEPAHAEAFRIELELWQIAGSLEAGFLGDADDAAYSAGSYSLPAGYVPAKRPFPSHLAQAAIGIFALVICALLIFSDDLLIMAQADATTSAGHQIHHTLPDGSIAHLNTDSALAIDYSEKERRVRLLKGEVFFNVRADKSRPFLVEARKGVTEAVGTAFAVRETEDEVAVTVAEGKVAVFPEQHSPASSDQGVIVKADQMIAFGKSLANAGPEKVDIKKSLAWRAGRIVFEGTPFKQALAELDRYFPGRIIVAKSTDGLPAVTGIVQSDELIAGIRAIAAVQGLSASKMPGDLLIILH